jgi:hypothetical protein
LHYRDLGIEGRAEALDAIGEMAFWAEAVIAETSSPVPDRYSEHRVRADVLSRLFPHLDPLAVELTVLEGRGKPGSGFEPIDHHEHRTVQALLSRGEVSERFRIDHRSKDEILLALPDLCAGARSDHICGVGDSLYPRIAHKVVTILRV